MNVFFSLSGAWLTSSHRVMGRINIAPSPRGQRCPRLSRCLWAWRTQRSASHFTPTKIYYKTHLSAQRVIPRGGEGGFFNCFSSATQLTQIAVVHTVKISTGREAAAIDLDQNFKPLEDEESERARETLHFDSNDHVPRLIYSCQNHLELPQFVPAVHDHKVAKVMLNKLFSLSVVADIFFFFFWSRLYVLHLLH